MGVGLLRTRTRTLPRVIEGFGSDPAPCVALVTENRRVVYGRRVTDNFLVVSRTFADGSLAAMGLVFVRFTKWKIKQKMVAA